MNEYKLKEKLSDKINIAVKKKLVLRYMFGCVPDMIEPPESLLRKFFKKLRRLLWKYTKR